MRTLAATLLVLFAHAVLLPPAMADPAADNGEAAPSVTLVEAVRYALSHSREVAIADKDLRIAEQGKVKARAGRLPKVEASGDYTALSDPPSFFILGGVIQFADQEVFRARVTAEQRIFDFGKTASRISRAEAKVDAAVGLGRLTRERLTLDVIAAFLSARRAEEIRKVAEESLAAAREHRKVAGDRYDLGVVAKNDVLAADVQVANAEAVRISAENQVEMARSRLALRMGYPGDRVVVPAPEEFPVPGGPEPVLGDSLRAAMKNRVELSVQETSIREGEAAAAGARAEFTPTFFGQGNYSYESNSFNPFQNVFSVVVGGKVNLFSGFSDEAARREALLSVDRGKESLRLLQDEISLYVKTAHLALVEAEKRKAVSEVAVSRAEENLRIENDRYGEGLAISTEVLDAQTLLSRAKVDRENASFDLYEARFGLLFARGELLEYFGPVLGGMEGGTPGR